MVLNAGLYFFKYIPKILTQAFIWIFCFSKSSPKTGSQLTGGSSQKQNLEHGQNLQKSKK
jgi:hypothetical protein